MTRLVSDDAIHLGPGRGVGADAAAESPDQRAEDADQSGRELEVRGVPAEDEEQHKRHKADNGESDAPDHHASLPRLDRVADSRAGS